MTRIFSELTKGIRIDALGVAMPGPRLRDRVRQIVNGGGAAPRISRARAAFLVAACVAVCGASLAGTVARARREAGQSTASLAAVNASAMLAQQLTFDVASVKVVKLDSHPVFGNSGGPGTDDPGRATNRVGKNGGVNRG